MPANLPPDYHDAEARFRAARTPDDKLAALQEMLRIVPKHKGTEKIQADLKTRIAKLKRQPKKKTATRTFTHHIPREGAGQVALVGPPNSGKSTLVTRLTHATPEVADYPYTTREPVPGMMPFEDIAFQLIDLPPLGEEFVEHWVFDLIRGADLIWLVVAGSSSLEGMELVQRLLAEKHIEVLPAGSEPAAERPAGWTRKPGLLIVTGQDKPGSEEDLGALKELLDRPWPTVPVASPEERGFEEIRHHTYEALGILRVYTKQPGKPPDRSKPFTMIRGASVADLARLIHKDLLTGFKFARVWGSEVFDGQTVQREHVLAEGDVVEIHM